MVFKEITLKINILCRKLNENLKNVILEFLNTPVDHIIFNFYQLTYLKNIIYLLFSNFLRFFLLFNFVMILWSK